jgi:hypothetical protein
MEECASSMGLRSNTNDAVVMDVLIKLRRKEYASSMGQRQSANTMDAKIMWSREECALSMGQGQSANTRDAPIMLRREECASSMEQRLSANTRDAQIMWSREECAGGTERTAILMKNLLLLHHAMDLNSKRLLLLTPLINVLQQVLRATVVYLEW